MSAFNVMNDSQRCLNAWHIKNEKGMHENEFHLSWLKDFHSNEWWKICLEWGSLMRIKFKGVVPWGDEWKNFNWGQMNFFGSCHVEKLVWNFDSI